MGQSRLYWEVECQSRLSQSRLSRRDRGNYDSRNRTSHDTVPLSEAGSLRKLFDLEIYGITSMVSIRGFLAQLWTPCTTCARRFEKLCRESRNTEFELFSKNRRVSFRRCRFSVQNFTKCVRYRSSEFPLGRWTLDTLGYRILVT